MQIHRSAFWTVPLVLLAGCTSSPETEHTYDRVVHCDDSYPADVQAVQEAVEPGGTVLIVNTSIFGDEPTDPMYPANNPDNRVHLRNDVRIIGARPWGGEHLTTIKGGVWSFHSPLPAGASPTNPPTEPGPAIAIEDIHFTGAWFTPIQISYSSVVKFAGNKIDGVRPWPVYFPNGDPQMFNDLIDGTPYHLHLQEGVDIGTRRSMSAFVPGAVTGVVEIVDNEVDLEADNPDLVNPRSDLGQGILVNYGDGAAIQVSGNDFIGVSRNSIEVLDNYRDADGEGSVTIDHNSAVTPEDGIAFPGSSTPNGIVVGAFFDLTANTDPDRNPPIVIEHNYIEVHGTRLYGSAIIPLGDSTVVQDNHLVVEGASTAGNVGVLFLTSNNLAAQNRVEGEGQSAFRLIPAYWSVGMVADGNTLTGNDLSHFAERFADVLFADVVVPTDAGEIVYSADNNTLVVDEGTKLIVNDTVVYEGADDDDDSVRVLDKGVDNLFLVGDDD